jgi:hypothetical protein
MIVDSGNRQQFYDADGNPMGVRDIQEGKGRCDLLPLDVVGKILDEIDDPACILLHIADFIETGSTSDLYDALESFCDSHYWNSLTMILEVAIHMAEGAKKYGERNWQKGIPVCRYIDSSIRHYLKYLRGDKDERHDRAFCWNVMCAIWTCKHLPELNEYAKPEKE